MPTRKPQTIQEQINQITEREAAHLLDDCLGQGINLTDNELACFRAGMAYALSFAQQAHDDTLRELGHDPADFRR